MTPISRLATNPALACGAAAMRRAAVLLMMAAAVTPALAARAQGEGPATAPASQPVPDAMQDLDIQLLELEVPVVVSATRHEEPIEHLPYAVTVLTQDDLRATGARTIPEALRLAPGVDVAELASHNYGVSARGLHGSTANQLLVLIDGRQIFDALFGGTSWVTWPVSVEDVERIEILRGPAGVAWGPNAVNGVINIITKDPSDALGLTLRTGGGSRGLHHQYLGYGFKEDKWRVRVSGEHEADDGYFGGTKFSPLDDQFRHGHSRVDAVYDAGPRDTLRLSAGAGLNEAGQLLAPAPFTKMRDVDTQTNYAMAKWTHRIERDSEVDVTAYVNDYGLSFSLPGVEYRYQQAALQLAHRFKPGEKHTTTWGIDTRTDFMDGDNSEPAMLSKAHVTTGIVGAYIQDAWRFAPKWSLNLGGRIDYDTYGGFQPSARAALSREIAKNTFLYGAVSRAFHMPPGASRFIDVSQAGGLAYIKGHRSMDAQTLLAYELGMRGRYFNRLETNVNLFWNEYDDVITLSPRLGPPGLIVYDRDNRGEMAIYGVELDAKYKATRKLTLLGNYTFQEYQWRSAVAYTDTDLITPPEHKFMLGARYDFTADLHASAHVYYVDTVSATSGANPFTARKIPDYLRLDLRGEYEFWNDRASISVGVRNLLDPMHPEGGGRFVNDANVPRVVYAELRIRFE